MATDPVLAMRKKMIAAILERLAHAEYAEMTQAALAEMLGITRARLALLRGKQVDAFSLESLARVAMALGLTVRVSVTRPYSQD